MGRWDIDAYAGRSRALDLRGLAWEDVARHPLPPAAVRTLRYMQDIESHTIVYLRTLLSTRAVDEPDVAAFLACWLYEETFHGRALARFLGAAGQTTVARVRSRASLGRRLEALATGLVARAWPDFVAVHMAWGAINELTTLTGYARLAALAGHPVLRELLARIMRDESRHFAFYYRQAERRLSRPGAARLTRLLVDRFWAPVGSGVQPEEETRFLAGYLFAGPDGRRAARRVDERIRCLPGFGGVRLLEAWTARALGAGGTWRAPGAPSGSEPLPMPSWSPDAGAGARAGQGGELARRRGDDPARPARRETGLPAEPALGARPA